MRITTLKEIIRAEIDLHACPCIEHKRLTHRAWEQIEKDVVDSRRIIADVFKAQGINLEDESPTTKTLVKRMNDEGFLP